MQTQGSLQESDLASLLQTMQSERATGTLTLEEDGSGSVSLFFLFGHLFHATAPDGDGEDVVIRALGWHDGSYHFDPRAKLPAEETIKSSPAELIAAAEQSGGAEEGEMVVAGSSATSVPSLRAIDGHAGSAGEPPASDSGAWAPAASVPEPAPAAQGAWSPVAVENGATGTTADAWSAARPADPAPTYAPADYSPTYVPAEPAPVADVAQPTAASGGGSPEGSPVTAGSSTSTPVGALPIPAGNVQYEGLKSAFVDFPRLLRTLRSDHHTGFIRLVSGDSGGVLLFRDGEVIEAEAGDDGSAHGEEAFVSFRRQMDTGQGLIDVVDIDTDTVTSIARLLTGPALYTGLLARFVNFPALLEYLGEEHIDGSVIVVGGSETGVILLKNGEVLAAYTAGNRSPQTSTDAVAALASERPARIEVRGDDTSRAPIDTEAALSRPF